MTLTYNRLYVEKRGDDLFIAGSRVTLDSVVVRYLNGFAPERIMDSYPALSLEQIHGAIAFYLANRDAVDTYLKEKEAWFDDERERKWSERPELRARLVIARERYRRDEESDL